MKRGVIPINKEYELEYRYYDRDNTYRYFNRLFEVFLLKKNMFNRSYVMHMDNRDKNKMIPLIYRNSKKKSLDMGITTLNWNDIKNNFLDFIIEEIGEKERENAKKAIGKLSSPKI